MSSPVAAAYNQHGNDPAGSVASHQPHGYGWPYHPNATIVDAIPKDMLYMIHEHWYKFPPMSPLSHILLGVTMIVMGVVSVAGNGVVLYLMMTTKSLRTPTNMLIVNLAFADFCTMAFQTPITAINCFAETWVLGPLMCELYAMCGSVFGCGSIWTMVAISIDRYNVIVRGMSAAPLTHKKAAIYISLIWVWAITWTLLPFIGWNRFIPEGNMSSCSLDYLTKDWSLASFVIVYPTFVYFTPLLTMIYCYSFIVRAVAHHEKQLKEQAKKMNVASLRANADQQKTSAEMKLAKV